MIGAAISDEELYEDCVPVNKSGFYLRLSQKQVVMAYFGSSLPQQISGKKTQNLLKSLNQLTCQLISRGFDF